jgi:hypothetical protein
MVWPEAFFSSWFAMRRARSLVQIIPLLGSRMAGLESTGPEQIDSARGLAD